ncbi:MAG: AEC family transporter [Clostridiales bacterium]|nr:AEC family transporter [Clostridiales bacterium]
MSFNITLVAVAVMLLYAVPGYIMIKTKTITPESIPAFAKLLMYVCQPCLTVYSFAKVPYTTKLLKEIILFFIITLVLMMVILAIFYVLFSKKRSDIGYRVSNVGVCFGNVAFMGVPLVESILPEYPQAVIFCSIFLLAMNILGWTAASAIITRDKKYFSIKKVLLNPAVLSLLVALPLFFTGTVISGELSNMITILGKMTTPLCMLIMGMRLATVEVKAIFTNRLQYFTVFMKQIVMPLIALAIAALLPVDKNFKITLFILCGCPIASVVLNFAEMLGEGQETAANMVLLGTLLSVITIPVMMLIV